jgi:flagellar biosynthesis protein FliR
VVLEAAPEAITGFVLVLVRAIAWIIVAPPFSMRAIPIQVKLGLAAALALSTGPGLAGQSVPLETVPLIGATLTQVAIGLVLGFLTMMLISAVQAAGEMIDMFSGFSISAAFNPLSDSSGGVFARFYHLLALTLLFAINGHLLLIRGFLTSFKAVPLSGVPLNDLSSLFIDTIGQFVLAAVEIAAPLLAVLFLAEIGLGLLSRAAPQINVFALGFSIKILVALGLAGLAIPVLPSAVTSLVEGAVRNGGTALTTLVG